MDNQTRIIKYSKDFIRETFKKEDIRQFFLYHPRIKKFHNNMCEELMKIEYAKLRTFDVHKFKRVVEDMTKVFCNAALKQKEQKLMSEIQRSDETKRIEKESKDEVWEPGELEDLGIIEVERDDSQLNPKLKSV